MAMAMLCVVIIAVVCFVYMKFYKYVVHVRVRVNRVQAAIMPVVSWHWHVARIIIITSCIYIMAKGATCNMTVHIHTFAHA
jgi:hypothetical protein